jgi:hypothetical protein
MQRGLVEFESLPGCERARLPFSTYEATLGGQKFSYEATK